MSWRRFCYADATWRPITKDLKMAYEEHSLQYAFPTSWRHVNVKENFAVRWYMELYATLPTYSRVLPGALNNYYSRYFKDLPKFISILRYRSYSFDSYNTTPSVVVKDKPLTNRLCIPYNSTFFIAEQAYYKNQGWDTGELTRPKLIIRNKQILPKSNFVVFFLQN